jgi:hypothetical protein
MKWFFFSFNFNPQNAYHPYEAVEQVAIVLENILPYLNVCHI